MGVLFEDGSYVETLPPGKYAFWKNMAKVMLVPVDLRETMLDIGGQEIMTADKVTLRLNAVATYRVALGNVFQLGRTNGIDEVRSIKREDGVEQRRSRCDLQRELIPNRAFRHMSIVENYSSDIFVMERGMACEDSGVVRDAKSLGRLECFLVPPLPLVPCCRLKPQFAGLLECLLDKLIIRDNVKNTAIQLVEQGLSSHQPDERFAAACVHLNDGIGHIPRLAPLAQCLSLRFPDVLNRAAKRQLVEDFQGILLLLLELECAAVWVSIDPSGGTFHE